MGAYFNPNFRRGEPELASRVRYDHPLAMSGSSAAAIRNHQSEKMNALLSILEMSRWNMDNQTLSSPQVCEPSSEFRNS